MHRQPRLTLLLLALIAFAATPALAAKSGGKKTATISFASADGASASIAPTNGNTVTFAVSSPLEGRTLLVVTNRCWRDGQVVYNEYGTVTNGSAGPFTLSLTGTGSATCEAYVWAFPDSTTPLSGGWMGYTVS
jgi:hypothetical protein